MKAFPIRTAIEKDIKLIFYAENGECYYGGNVLHDDAERKDIWMILLKIKLEIILQTGLTIMLQKKI